MFGRGEFGAAGHRGRGSRMTIDLDCRPPQGPRSARIPLPVPSRPDSAPIDAGSPREQLKVVVLAGGVGGARFVRGLRHHVESTPGLQGTQITVVVNTGDDITMHGLRVCPDIDTMLYTLGGGVDEDRGWGRAVDSHCVESELAAYGASTRWFTLSDKDLGTHIARTQWLAEGVSLTEVTARLAYRWRLPEQGIQLLPMSDEPAETGVVVQDDKGEERTIHFQEWWVRHQAAIGARRFILADGQSVTPGKGVLEAIEQAHAILLPPSNPIVSIGTILSVQGVRNAIRQASAPVIGVSPLISGRPVRGHADVCLSSVGVPVTSAGVASLYEDFLDGWLVDPADAQTAVAHARLEVFEGPLLMSDVPRAGRIAARALAMASRITT